MDNFLGKGGGPKKRFQYCLNPDFSKHSLYFRAIQGHSGGDLVDPTLQDNVLLPDDFAQYICHIGNGIELHSVIKSGLFPGGRSLRKDRQSVFFTAVNPMYAGEDLEEVLYDLDKPRTAVYKHTWKAHQNTVYWCHLKLAQRKGLQFYQTRSHAITLFNTLPAICFEKVVYMKTGEELYCKVHQSPRLPRVVLTPSSRHGRQDQPNPDARKSLDHQANSVCTGKPVAHFSRTHVVNITERVSDVCTWKPVAVTLITEVQVYLTQPFRKWTQIAKKQSKDRFNSSRTTRTGTGCYKTSTKLRRSIHSVKSRRT